MIYVIASSVGAALSGIATSIAVFIAYKVHISQKILAQRQLIIPLWDHMATLNKIDRNSPITPDIIKNLNTLELVALCCEGGMIDEGIIKRTFKDQFIMHYDDIKGCQKIPGINESGESLVRQNKAATQFYISLESERLQEDRVKKI